MTRLRSPADLGREHLGRRVTIRYRLGDGKKTDVVGILEAIDETRVRVRTRRDDVVAVARDGIVAVRLVLPPDPRGRAPALRSDPTAPKTPGQPPAQRH